LRELLYVLLAPMTSIVGLAAFTFWWSAAIFVAGIGVGTFYAVKRHEKHHRAEAFDDKLTTERMESAREWLIENQQ
jgi:hypothetical protein